jgi:NAD(P)H dehydrogenase (quinone)
MARHSRWTPALPTPSKALVMVSGTFDNAAPILVTGATGRHGGTGRAVARSLIARGLRVRALVRKMDGRADAIAAEGAELVIADYADYASLLRALDGVRHAYFCYPVGAGIAEAAGLFATAGKEQGLQRIVDLSLRSTSPDSATPQGRAQWVAEKIFEWAGFDGVHLRIAAFFMENLLKLDAESVRTAGSIANAFGDAALSWVSGADVGRLAAALIADPTLASERVLVAPGTVHLTYPQIAQRISAVLGRHVGYSELTSDDWRQALIDQAERRGDPNVRGADHLVAQSKALRARAPMPVSDLWERMTGLPSISFSAFVEAHRGEFEPTSGAARRE